MEISENSFDALSWADFALVLVLIFAATFGYKKASVRAFLDFGWLLLAVVLAWIYRQNVGDNLPFRWFATTVEGRDMIGFLLILSILFLVKTGFYQTVKMAIKIPQPCALNYPFVIGFFAIMTVWASGHYLDDFAGLGVVEMIFSTNPGFAFLALASIISAAIWSFFKLFNLSIGTNPPCFLAPVFEKILAGGRFLHGTFFAENPEKNRWLGAIFGLASGFLWILILVFLVKTSGIGGQNFALDSGVAGIFHELGMWLVAASDKNG